MHLGFARYMVPFPFEQSRLRVEEMDWNPRDANQLRQYPLNLYADGACLSVLSISLIPLNFLLFLLFFLSTHKHKS